MALTKLQYEYQGSNLFAISFPLGYLNRDNVDARVNNEVDGAGNPVYRSITWIGENVISVGGTLNNGDIVEITRTVDSEVLINDYQDGAIQNADNLDDSFKQAIMLTHQVLDGRFEAFAVDLPMGNNKITSLADPTDPQDAATKNYIDTFEAINTAAILEHVQEAKDWANEDEDVVVNSGEYSAKHYAAKASASAALLPLNKVDATTAPTVDNDSSEGYSKGSRWIDVNNVESYICLDDTVGAAVWVSSTLTTDELGSLALLDDVAFSNLNPGAVASQTEAENGVADNVVMTPERTLQAHRANSSKVLLETVDVSTPTSEVVFTSGIDDTYNRYIVEISNMYADTNSSSLGMRTSSDGGVTYDQGAADYDAVREGRRLGGTIDTESTPTTTAIGLCVSETSISNTADKTVNFDVTIFDPSNTDTQTIIGWTGRGINSSNNIFYSEGAANRKEANIVDAVQFYTPTGNIAGGTFKLYGLR